MTVRPHSFQARNAKEGETRTVEVERGPGENFGDGETWYEVIYCEAARPNANGVRWP